MRNHDGKRNSTCYDSTQEEFRDLFEDAETRRDLGLMFRWRLPGNVRENPDVPWTGDRLSDHALACVVAEALAAAPTGRAVSFSLRKGWWIGRERNGGPAYTYAYVRRATEILHEAGLIHVTKSPPRKGGTGWQSSFVATDDLLGTVSSAGLIYGLNQPILMRDSNGEPMPLPLPDTRDLDRTARRLARRNEAFASVDLRLMARDVAWTPDVPMMIDGRWYDPRRKQAHIVFNGDVRHGGRLYGLPYMTLSQRRHGRRDQLRIDGSVVDERDFSGCHPRALYHLRGAEADGDLYDVHGHPYGRDGAKLAVQVLLNATGAHQGIPALAWKFARDEAKAEKEAGGETWDRARIDARAREHLPDCRDLCDALKKKHAPIADALFTGAGLSLQAIETTIMTKAAMRLLDRSIVSFPMHDSAFVEARHGDHLQEAMERAYVETLDRKPVITAHQPIAA